MSQDSPLLFLVAGEPSGDLIGARLMAALRRLSGGRARFAGVGGERMIAEGLIALFPMSDLSVMGFSAVARRAPLLYRRLHQTVADVQHLRPDALITIDSPGFNVRLARRLASRRFPIVHVVAPTVWAWRPRRARTIARLVDHLLALFPFEPPYFEAEGLATTFIGHPIVEEPIAGADGGRLRDDLGIPAEREVVAILPGSREDEVRRLMPVFGAALRLCAERRGPLHAVIPTLSAVAPLVAEGLADWTVPASLVTGTAERYAAFAAARAAMAASGSVILELARAEVPTVVAYRTSAATAFVARRLVRIPHASLVNILAGEEVMPEFLQERCRPEALAAALVALLDDGEARVRQRDAGRAALTRIGLGQSEPPGMKAARAVLDTLASARRGGRPPQVPNR
jgi:lipid-A-disaccharide synthase